MMISTTDLIGKFQQAINENWGYIWGTAGVKWTEAKQKELEQTTDEDRAMGRKYGSKWIGHMVADCSGLFTWAFKQLGGTMYHGSNTMYLKWCDNKGSLSAGKRTDGQELKPGTAVFVYNSTKKNYSHVGLYIGGGTVIEAEGTIKGVITSKVTLKKWTNWGELKGVDYSGATPEPTPTPTPTPTTKPTLRRGDKGPYVVEMQTELHRLDYGLGPCGIDGDFGRATEAAVKSFQYDKRLTIDGICGPKTWAALDAAVEDLKAPAPSTVTYTVSIPGLDLTQARKLVEAYPGAEIVKGEDGK